MNEFWYPFYPVVFRRATRHLTAEQKGMYRDMIDEYMESREPLPDNDAALANICGVTLECFLHASSILKAFFRQEDGFLYHDFCNEILDDQDKRTKKFSVRSKKAHAARWNKRQKPIMLEACLSDASAMLKNATRQDKTEHNNKKIFMANIEGEFAEFWSGWKPHDIGKGNRKMAEKSFAKARRNVSHETILKGRDAYLAHCHARTMRTQHAVTWLNQRGWETDWNEEQRAASGAGQIIPVDRSAWPEWKRMLAVILGDAVIVSWFSNVELLDDHLTAPTKFIAERINADYASQLCTVFARDIRCVAMPKVISAV